MWTHFMDMHSGGGQKLEWAHIYIEAPEKEAKLIFQNAFGRNPERVTCTCCGEDYSVTEAVSLAQASGYERGCRAIEPPRLKDGRWYNNHPYLKEHGCYLEEGEEPPKGFKISEFSRSGKCVSLEAYIKQPGVKVIAAGDIKPEWREGELRQEGYYWAD